MSVTFVSTIVILVYVLGAAALVVIAILSWILWDKRFKSNQYTENIPLGFVKTDEFIIDPTTNKRLNVYYNPATGDRFYKDETEKRS